MPYHVFGRNPISKMAATCDCVKKCFRTITLACLALSLSNMHWQSQRSSALLFEEIWLHMSDNQNWCHKLFTSPWTPHNNTAGDVGRRVAWFGINWWDIDGVMSARITPPCFRSVQRFGQMVTNVCFRFSWMGEFLSHRLGLLIFD